MNKRKQNLFVLWIVIGLLMVVGVSPARCDLGSVGMVSQLESKIADVIRSGTDTRRLFDEFNKSMAEYETQRDKCNALVDPAEKARCKENVRLLLDRARDILSKLNLQADSVEARIALIGNDKAIDTRYLQKLDRVLASVKQLRNEAGKRLGGSIRDA